MREAIAGFYGSNFRNDLLILLLCYVPISLLIGLGLRPALSGLNHLFDKKLAETEFMMCEPHEAELQRSTQLSMLLQASLSIEDLRLVTAERAQKFENNYHKMIRIGFLAIAIIPLIFLILMFSLESKIVFLTLWIISIIAISVWLIIVEYIHTKLEEQKELAGMSYEEMLKTSVERRRNNLKNIFLILKNDLMKIQKNVIAMVVIMGITVIPTLYAWFNISASWDPYGNTGALKLAVASDDKGYESDLIAVKINMGEQILSSLHKNSQFNWVFTDSKDAQKGVKSGECYAAIVIPEDFSQKMMSVFSF